MGLAQAWITCEAVRVGGQTVCSIVRLALPSAQSALLKNGRIVPKLKSGKVFSKKTLDAQADMSFHW